MVGGDELRVLEVAGARALPAGEGDRRVMTAVWAAWGAVVVVAAASVARRTLTALVGRVPPPGRSER